MTDDDAELTELAKRRGFFFGANGAYGGTAGFYTYGPQGAALKRNVEEAWRDRFTVRQGNFEIEAPTIMPEAVFEASGHLDDFDDMLLKCPDCAESHRADHLIEDMTDIEDAEALPIADIQTLLSDHEIGCPTCGTSLGGEPVENFNLMFETAIGPGTGQRGFLRPETAQGIFVEFPRLKEYARGRLPFGVTQVGAAYRNEISPRKGIVRVREFTQAELETFIDPESDEPPLGEVADTPLELYPAARQDDDETDSIVNMTVKDAVDNGVIESPWIAYYLGLARRWYARIGIDMERFRFRQHLPGELAHYAGDCWDAETEVDGDWIEITGFAYRSDYDLAKHAEYSQEDFTVFKQYDHPKTVERARVDPDMSELGPKFGADAEAVAEALETLVTQDPDAFAGDTITVELDDEEHTIDASVANFAVEEQTESGEHIRPHVIEPSFGIGRVVYAVLAHALRTDQVDEEPRDYLALKPEVAPTDAAVFPLVTNNDQLVTQAQETADGLRAAGLAVTYDDSGSIGRRYRRQDEVGTPYCVTVDPDGLEGPAGPTVTVRERDSAAQVRLPAKAVPEELTALLGDQTFNTLLERYDTVDTDVTTS